MPIEDLCMPLLSHQGFYLSGPERQETKEFVQLRLRQELAVQCNCVGLGCFIK
jgi:hypothetical protein